MPLSFSCDTCVIVRAPACALRGNDLRCVPPAPCRMPLPNSLTVAARMCAWQVFLSSRSGELLEACWKRARGVLVACSSRARIVSDGSSSRSATMGFLLWDGRSSAMISKVLEA